MSSFVLRRVADIFKKSCSIRSILSFQALRYTTNAVTTPFDEDIPFFIVSHAVQKAYVVHTMRTDPKALAMNCWLTKTTMPTEIPINFDNWIPSQNTLNNFGDVMIQNSGKYVRSKEKHRFTDDELVLGRLYGLFHHGLCEVNANVHHDEVYIDYKPRLKTHWIRSYDYFQYEDKPGLVLRGKKPLKALPECFTSGERSEVKPGPFDTYSMRMFRHNTLKLQNWPGYFNVNRNPYSFVHTLFLSTRAWKAPTNLVAGGVVSCFAHLVSEAQARGELFGTQLEQPMVAQCIATDGVDISFVVYKLKTLSLQDDRGVWNEAWSAGPFKLHTTSDNGDEQVATYDLQFVDYLMNMLSRSLVQ